MKKFIVAVFIFLMPLQLLFANADMYPFRSPDDATRFHTLTTELRCLVCQNQNIAESNAGLANDLRNEIYQQIQAGQSNADIIHYLVARYGDFILYKPPINVFTLGLWVGPLLLLLSGLGYLIYTLRGVRPSCSHSISD